VPKQFFGAKEVTLADVLSQVPLNVRFNRALIGNKWYIWVHLIRRLMGLHLNDEPYNFKWHLITKDVFTVKCMYAD
jgi:hypothetical protein